MPQRLTPIDVLNIRFARKFTGYSIAEVDEFVHKVATDLEAAVTECATQKERVTGLERELEQYRSLEAAMRDALMLAQKAADDTRSAAHAQSQTLLQEAHRKAAEIEVATERVKGEHRRVVHEVRAKLKAQLEWLEEEAPSLPLASPISPVSLSASITDVVVSKASGQ